jgi:hypothetical protein
MGLGMKFPGLLGNGVLRMYLIVRTSLAYLVENCALDEKSGFGCASVYICPWRDFPLS